MDRDNDQAQRDAPGGEAAQESQRSWVGVLVSDANQVGTTVVATVASAAALYGVKQAWDKIHKPPDPPPSAGSEGGLYAH